jgi:hypothetical protein
LQKLKKFKEKLLNNKIYIIFFLLYASISFGLIFFHEQWRDEAQSWLLAKNLSIIDLIKHLKYEGHFLLWYLIIMPFAKLGFPYVTQNIISWFFTVLAGAIFLLKAPFSNRKKVLLLFSFPMLYLFPIVARCYCLIPLAIVMTAMFYKDRYEKPIRYVLSIVFIANTHVIMLGMAGYLLLEFIIEAVKRKNDFSKNSKKTIIFSLILVFILLFLTAAPLFGCLSFNKDVGTNYPLWYKILGVFLLEPLLMVQELFEVIIYNNFFAIIIFVLSFYIVLYEIKNNKLEFLKIWIILLWQYLIYVTIYGMSSQRAATVIWIIIFFAWTRQNKKDTNELDEKFLKISIILLLILNIINGIIFISLDIKYNYSSAKQTADFIDQNIEEESVMITGSQAEFCSSIMAHTDKVKFYYIQRKDYFTYAVLDSTSRLGLLPEDFYDVLDEFDDSDNLYYVYTPTKVSFFNDKKTIDELVENGRLEKIFESDKAFEKNEEYIIYKINR